MARYANVDKLIWQVQNNDKYGTITKQVFISLLQNSETEDVAPVVHAHWIKHGEPPWYVIECSECGAKWQMSGSWDANNFCGNCGAKMDEEVE